MIKKKLLFLSVVILTLQQSIVLSNDKNVYIKEIVASCLVEKPDKFYSAIFLIDGTEKSWAAEPSKDGCGEEIYLEFTEICNLSELYFKNGFGLKNYFIKNNRVKEIVILTQDSESSLWNEEFVIELKDISDFQKIIFPHTLKTNLIKLIIKSIYKGTVYNDTCLTEIALHPIEVKDYDFKPEIDEDHAIEIKGEYPSDFYLLDSGNVDISCYDQLRVWDWIIHSSDWGYTNDGQVYVRLIKKTYVPMSDPPISSISDDYFVYKTFMKVHHIYER